MGIKLTFNGKPIDSEHLSDALAREFKLTTENVIAEKFASVRCTDHPDFVPAVTGSLDDMIAGTASLSVCCAKLRSILTERS